jgi:hypothetical protein
MPGRNRMRRGAKFDEQTLSLVIVLFCQGHPVKGTARITKLTPKTVRELYLGLRDRLLARKFSRWHGEGLVYASDPMSEMYESELHSLRLAECANNRNCARNWRLGNRKTRRCRRCPLPTILRLRDLRRSYVMIDAVHDFYEALGIRGEKTIAPDWLFRVRFIHTLTVAIVLDNTPKLPNGFIDIGVDSFLSGGKLMRMLVEDLLDRPL